MLRLIVMFASGIVVLIGCKRTKPAGDEPAITTAGSAAKPIDAGSAAVAAQPSCAGWQIVQMEELGMGTMTTTVSCADDRITLVHTSEGAHDEAPTNDTVVLTRDQWSGLWATLESAQWRDLDPACPPPSAPMEGTPVTGLKLTITDGKVTKTIECEGVNLTERHIKIMDALEAARRSGTPDSATPATGAAATGFAPYDDALAGKTRWSQLVAPPRGVVIQREEDVTHHCGDAANQAIDDFGQQLAAKSEELVKTGLPAPSNCLPPDNKNPMTRCLMGGTGAEDSNFAVEFAADGKGAWHLVAAEVSTAGYGVNRALYAAEDKRRKLAATSKCN